MKNCEPSGPAATPQPAGRARTAAVVGAVARGLGDAVVMRLVVIGRSGGFPRLPQDLVGEDIISEV